MFVVSFDNVSFGNVCGVLWLFVVSMLVVIAEVVLVVIAEVVSLCLGVVKKSRMLCVVVSSGNNRSFVVVSWCRCWW
jgi:hypothetical protein